MSIIFKWLRNLVKNMIPAILILVYCLIGKIFLLYNMQRVTSFLSGAYGAEGQQFFLTLTFFRVSLGLSHVFFSSSHSPPLFSFDQSPKKEYLFDRRLYRLQAKISEHAVCIWFLICTLFKNLLRKKPRFRLSSFLLS